MQIKNRQQILIAAAIVVVALFALDKIVISPLTKAWQDRSKSVTELRNRVATAAASSVGSVVCVTTGRTCRQTRCQRIARSRSKRCSTPSTAGPRTAESPSLR